MAYLYCPIGNKIADYIDTLDNIRYTYPSHGYGKIDWMIDGGSPVYSMTNGTIVKVSRVHDEYSGQNQKGYYVYVQPTGIGKTDILIRYLEMGGLSQEIVNQLTKESLLNAGGTATYSTSDPADSENCEIPISQGDLIGYTNGFRSDHQSSLHIDFLNVNATSDGLSNAANAPQINESSLASDFTVQDNKIYQNNNIIGTANGKVPRQGGSDSEYNVWPYYSYCIQLQPPIKKGGSNSSAKYDKNVDINTYITYTEEDKKAALGVMSFEAGTNPPDCSLEAWGRVLRNRIAQGYSNNLASCAESWLGSGESYSHEAALEYYETRYLKYTTDQQELLWGVVCGNNYGNLAEDTVEWKSTQYATETYLYNFNMLGAKDWWSPSNLICDIEGSNGKISAGYAPDVNVNGVLF